MASMWHSQLGDAPLFSSRQPALSHPLQRLAQCLRIQISVHVMHVSHPRSVSSDSDDGSCHACHAYFPGTIFAIYNIHTHTAAILYPCLVLTLAANVSCRTAQCQHRMRCPFAIQYTSRMGQLFMTSWQMSSFLCRVWHSESIRDRLDITKKHVNRRMFTDHNYPGKRPQTV